jgi:hypothetical protein
VGNDINQNIEMNNFTHGTWLNYFQKDESFIMQSSLYQNNEAITSNEPTPLHTSL